MPNRLKKYTLVLINAVLVFIIIIMQYTPLLSLKIGRAVPMMSLAAVVAISMFCSELTSSLLGAVIGIFTDTSSATAFGFNSIIFFIVGFFTSFIIHYLFNNNYRSAVALGLIMSFFYFIMKWLLFFALRHSLNDSFIYLFKYALPSLIYTAAITLILYFFQSFIFKKLALR